LIAKSRDRTSRKDLAFVPPEGDRAILNPEVFMKSKALLRAMPAVIVLASVVGVGAMGQEPKSPARFTGTIDDYTPSTVKGGPYEMHGTWSLVLHGHGNSMTADFSADLNMETSDFGTVNGNVDPTNPTTRGAHTHHIRLISTVLPYYTGCPTSIPVPPPTAAPPVTTTGFQFSNVVSEITGNGLQAPFEPPPPAQPTSNLTVCVTGGTDVEYSNVTLVFGAPALKHFGPDAIHGIVRKVELLSDEREHER
jgi:hypothetical protein